MAVANTVANSFAMVFLLRANFSYAECGLYVLLSTATVVVTLLLFFRFVTAKLKPSMILGLALLALYYLSFVVMQGYVMLITVSLLFGAYITFFWIPYNMLVMSVASRRMRGAIVGSYFLVYPIVAVLGPLLGGSIIQNLGYTTLFLIAASVLTADVLFLSLVRVLNPRVQRMTAADCMKRLDFRCMSRRLRTAFLGEGVQDGVFWVFPSVVGFELAKSEVSLGSLLSIFALAGAAMTVILGFASDRIRKRSIFLVVGGLFAALFCCMTAFVTDLSHFVLSMSLVSFFLAIVPAFLFTMLTDEMENCKGKAVWLREVLLNIGRMTGAGVCIIVSLAFGDLRYSILFAGIALIAVALSGCRKRQSKNGFKE